MSGKGLSVPRMAHMSRLRPFPTTWQTEHLDILMSVIRNRNGTIFYAPIPNKKRDKSTSSLFNIHNFQFFIPHTFRIPNQGIKNLFQSVYSILIPDNLLNHFRLFLHMDFHRFHNPFLLMSIQCLQNLSVLTNQGRMGLSGL